MAFINLVYDIPRIRLFSYNEPILVNPDTIRISNTNISNTIQIQQTANSTGTLRWYIGTKNSLPTTQITQITIDSNGLITITSSLSINSYTLYVIVQNPDQYIAGTFTSISFKLLYGV